MLSARYVYLLIRLCPFIDTKTGTLLLNIESTENLSRIHVSWQAALWYLTCRLGTQPCFAVRRRPRCRTLIGKGQKTVKGEFYWAIIIVHDRAPLNDSPSWTENLFKSFWCEIQIDVLNYTHDMQSFFVGYTLGTNVTEVTGLRTSIYGSVIIGRLRIRAMKMILQFSDS